MEKALEVTVNGQHSQTVGLRHNVGIVHAIVEIHGGILNLLLRAGDGLSGEELRWDAPDIKVGDEILIKVIEVNEPSAEYHRWPARPREIAPKTDPAA